MTRFLCGALAIGAFAGSTGACSGASSSDLTAKVDAGPDASLPNGGACTTAGVQKQIFAAKCATAGCHTGADPAGSLDLVSDGLEARIVGATASECGGQTLVVAGDPDGSYLFHKVNDATPPCGGRMPLGQNPLSAAEIACVRAWIGSLSAASTDGGTTSTDAGGDAGSVACQPGLSACGTSCVDTATDKSNCGQCGNACAVACSASTCVTSCPGNTTNCSGSCVNLTNDNLHCGSCTNACPTGKVCISSACSCGATVSFASALQPIFTASCTNAGCHSGALPKASLNLTSGKAYAALVNVASATCTARIRVKPGAVDQSYLWNKLTGVGMCAGTQMPKTGGTLPAAQLDAIRAWICNGAPNN